MGLKQSTISIGQHLVYEGQVEDDLPHGKGSLKLNSNTQITNQNKQQKINYDNWNIQGKFNRGELVFCEAINGDLKYQGQVQRGQFGGMGTLIDENQGLKWEGKFEGGQLVYGKHEKKNSYKCEGYFAQQKFPKYRGNEQIKQSQNKKPYTFFNFCGEGARFIWTNQNQSVEGNFQEGEVSGKGIYKFSNGDTYNGDFSNGYFEGKGSYYSTNKTIKSIVGRFKNSVPHSLGKNKQSRTKIIFQNEDSYQGHFENGQMHDKCGTYTFRSGLVYKGNIHFGKLSGECEIQYPADSQLQKYKGEIHEGILSGLGVLWYKNGVMVKGYFTNNMKNGPCLLIEGGRTWKCLYIMDKPEGELVEVRKGI